ncbi:hypothetical protein [Flavobacterium pectinovorum]|uniref:hypothetical protein n=1 Tax=Flavobacterium pectinovorum TaxID=29533 RepID=UPI001FADFFD6|nr:hypothetical protein [Flavobacterium pectinovorum]MCI9846096.1 hypothetical protein [Flavobacterium pectinovorum]
MGGLVKANEINSMYTYDTNGSKKVLFTDKKVIGTMFSVNKDALLVTDISSGVFNSKTKYLINDKYIELEKSEVRDMTGFYRGYGFFTAKNEFYLKNKKNEFDIDFEKDDIYLTVKDIVTRKKELYKIEKPSLIKFIGPNFIKSKEKFRFNLVVNKDETVDLDGKSISKDYTNTILYKTRFSNDGKKVDELVYDLKIANHVFLYSRNGGGEFTDGGYDNKFLHFGDDLSINNYIKDSETGDLYIYGLYGDEFGKLNDMANPKGFYIFKFDKSGNKIWESINKIDDAGFNSRHVMISVFIDLFQLNNNLCFNIKIGGLKSFFNYSIIDQSSGKIIKSQNIEFNETFAHPNNMNNYDYGINTGVKGFKDVKFSFESIIAINYYPKIADYIKSVNSKNDLYFSSYFSKLGIWLFETDNNQYYKVTFFKD